jgi:sirohydrochlorin cobaltochelatase
VNDQSPEDGRGVLLVGHGTRDATGTEQFFQLASLLTERLAPIPVESALLEFQEPTVPQGWRALVDRGVHHVRVAPLLLFAAGHAKQDIPDLLRGCQTQTPGVTFDQARPLSRHPAMMELVVRRLAETLSRSNASGQRTAVVMVGRGSYDPCAQADMRVLAEVASRRVEVGLMTTAFYAMANPRVPVVLDELASSKQFDTILVQPHLLFEGRLFQAVASQVDAAKSYHPSVQWLLSRYLGPDPLVAEAIAGRVLSEAMLAAW